MVRKTLGLSLLCTILLLFSSCEAIALFQLYPSDITQLEATQDIGDLFGIYNYHDGDINIRYVENRSDAYILVETYNNRDGYPRSAILDGDTLKVIATSSFSMDIFFISPSVGVDGENGWWGRYDYWDSDFTSMDINVDIENWGFIVYDSINDRAEIFTEEYSDGSSDAGPVELFQQYTITYDEINQTYVRTNANEPPEVQEILMLNNSGYLQMSRYICDLQTDEIIFIAFDYTNYNFWGYRGDRAHYISGATPIDLGTLNFGEDGFYLTESWANSFIPLSVYYTRKGWVIRSESDGLPNYQLYDLNTGAIRDTHSLSALYHLNADFSYDGKFLYCVNSKTMKITKLSTGW